MVRELNNILVEEYNALNNLLNLLDKQYKLIMEKKCFELEAIVDEIKQCNKTVAEKEVERRKLIGQNTMTSILENSDSRELDENYRKINRLLHELKLQKDTNDMLLKQQISFNNQILNIIKPRKEANTYNSYGSLRR